MREVFRSLYRCAPGKKRDESGNSAVETEPDWLTIWAFARQELELTDDEFWNYTWCELDALATAWRKRERRQDVRNALLRYTMACLLAKDPPKFEDLLPSDGDAPEATETEDERTMRKLDSVMFQYGGVVTDRPKAEQATPPEEDAFTQKMWRLMGVTEDK